MGATIVVGHYGSGKTEFAINYARVLQAKGAKPLLADLDIVNPYFRLREKKAAFEKQGIEVVASYCDFEPHLDMPALNAAIRRCFEGKEEAIVDVGGDANGARVLAQYAHLAKENGYNMWMMVNANRPQTTTVDEVRQYIKEIETTSRLPITGLVNTTHMLRDTKMEDVMRGDALVRAVAVETGLPVRYTAVLKKIQHQMDESCLAAKPLYLSLEMREEWL